MARIHTLLDWLRLLGFRLHLARIALRALPIAGGAPDGDGEGDGGDSGDGDTSGDTSSDGDGEADKGGEGDAGDAGDLPGAPAPDASVEEWKTYARQWERRAKKPNPKSERQIAKLRKENTDLAAKVKEREDSEKSDRDRDIENARKEARDEATGVYEKARRQDRLEIAITRLATKGIRVGDGDDAKTVKFADPDDAIVNLERAINRGDVDGDDIFGEDGKVQTSELTAALAELLDQKPHLAAKAADAKPDPGSGGSADGGKGAAPDPKGPSVESELAAIRKKK